VSEPRPHPFAPIKINLVEQQGWEKYDTASGGLEWAFDSGWEDFRHMDARTLADLIDDIASVPQKGKKKSKLDFDSEELRYLAEQLKEGNDQLQETQRMIVDAAQWMYEAAAIPTDGDIQDAMEKVKEDFISYEQLEEEDIWEKILTEKVRRGPMDWSPRKKYEIAEILKQLSERITLKHEKGKWDRFLVFDFWEARIVQELFSRHRGSPEAYEALKRDFERLSNGYVADVFKYLDKIMKDVDINNRTDWTSSWKSMLGSGEPWAAQKELVEVLKDRPEEPEDA
jgi:hypothetical protein